MQTPCTISSEATHTYKDIRSCVEQLQTIEKEVLSLDTSQKQLGDLKDHMDDKKIERSELQMKLDVRPILFLAHFLPVHHSL